MKGSLNVSIRPRRNGKRVCKKGFKETIQMVVSADYIISNSFVYINLVDSNGRYEIVFQKLSVHMLLWSSKHSVISLLRSLLVVKGMGISQADTDNGMVAVGLWLVLLVSNLCQLMLLCCGYYLLCTRYVETLMFGWTVSCQSWWDPDANHYPNCILNHSVLCYMSIPVERWLRLYLPIVQGMLLLTSDSPFRALELIGTNGFVFSVVCNIKQTEMRGFMEDVNIRLCQL